MPFVAWASAHILLALTTTWLAIHLSSSELIAINERELGHGLPNCIFNEGFQRAGMANPLIVLQRFHQGTQHVPHSPQNRRPRLFGYEGSTNELQKSSLRPLATGKLTRRPHFFGGAPTPILNVPFVRTFPPSPGGPKSKLIPLNIRFCASRN